MSRGRTGPPRRSLLALLFTLAALTLGAPRSPRAMVEDRAVLQVFAAASLTEAFQELGTQFEAAHPDVAVRFNFAGSQQLAAQIEQGAHADLFASADQRWANELATKGQLADSTQIFARNRLVVILPASNPARIDQLQDLAHRGVKLVLAAEAVPAGNYSREVIRRLAVNRDFPADFTERTLANVVSNEENVKAVVTKVQLGEADAGLVYRTDVTPAVARLIKIVEIPEGANVIASYPIAVTRESTSIVARDFVAFVLSAEGQATLVKHGFLPAQGASTP